MASGEFDIEVQKQPAQLDRFATFESFATFDSEESRPSRTAAALRVCSSIKSTELTPVMDDPSKNCIRDNVVNAQRQSQRELHHMAIGIVGELSPVLGLKSLTTEWYSKFA